MRRHELTNKQFELLEPYLPRSRPRGGPPWAEHRRILNGLLWKLHTGAQWRDIPERYAPWSTIYDRYRRWCQEGRFAAILVALRVTLDQRGLLSWEQMSVGRWGAWTRNGIGAFYSPCAITAFWLWEGIEYVANALRMYCMEAQGAPPFPRLGSPGGCTLTPPLPIPFVEGRLKTHSWTDEGGTTHYHTQVQADRVIFLDSRQA
jgi:transposase